MIQYRPMPQSETLPYALYRAEQVREFDRIAIEQYHIPGATLMERAGSEAFALIRKIWPEMDEITLLAGMGNNAGDAYVVARLVIDAGIAARVIQLGDPQQLAGDARDNYHRFLGLGGDVQAFTELPRRTGLFVDGLLGTGLARPVEGDWAEVIDAVNSHPAPVLSLDIPSGLDSDTGRVLGTAIRADHSISFIGLKQGMFTAEGPAYAGAVHFAPLEVPARVYASSILATRRIDWQKLGEQLPPRDRGAHKGDFGHVLVVGGVPGYGGAAILAASGSIRAGAGMATLATVPEHVSAALAQSPELMVKGIEHPDQLDRLLASATVVLVGPGLGQDEWGLAMWERVSRCGKPLVVDADALNLLAQTPAANGQWILTPHPGEAARLLGTDSIQIQQDRFAAVAGIVQKYGGIAVLKGAGTLIDDRESGPPALCSDGNPGMASGGMGDVLGGVIAGLLAQRFSLRLAAEIGVCVHAHAGDLAVAENGERGLLASDLMPFIHQAVNPRT